MMTNLFSTFDPTTSMTLSMNWLSTFLGMIIIPTYFWFMPSRIQFCLNKVIFKLNQEYSMLLKHNKKNFSILFISLFLFIMYNNMLGLLPYVFTSSSHLVFSLTLALPMWLSIMIFSWANQTKKSLAHLIPEGSPTMLMPFMVLIETISNFIRPSSLAIRLMANMIAGHLLMCLLGTNMPNTSEYMIPMLMLIQMMLMLFEMAVSIIQAYVFSILSTLYTSEITYEK